MAKILGYILTILGIVGIAAYALPNVKAAIPGITDVPDMYLMIVSVVLFLLGLFMSFRGKRYSSKKRPEVPIYHGKEVVGYRRH